MRSSFRVARALRRWAGPSTTDLRRRLDSLEVALTENGLLNRALERQLADIEGALSRMFLEDGR